MSFCLPKIGACGLVVLVAGCAAPSEPKLLTRASEPVRQTEEAIQGGYTDEADLSAVGIISTDGQYIFTCTGSLLAPNMVLTARHCVSDLAPSPEYVDCSVTTGQTPWPAQYFRVMTETDLNPYYEPWAYGESVPGYDVSEVITESSNKICGNDVAILILKTPIPAEVTKPFIPRIDSALVAAEDYYAIGYGQSSQSNYNSAGLRRRRDGLKVDCAESGCVGVQYYMTQTEWAGDTGICQGDSGGPAMDAQGRVVGVTSRGADGCDAPIYGSVHSHADWIKQSAIHAAEVGGYETPKWALGFPTDSDYNQPVGGDCQDNGCTLCWNDVCTARCNDTNAPCPDGFVCDEVQPGALVCTEIPPPPDGGGDGGGSSSDGGGSDEDDGCSVASRGAGADPTNPVPWLVGAAALAIVMTRRRRV